jgi:HK97 family phage major capsid protein
MKRALKSFDASTVRVVEGHTFSDDDPAVREHPEHFEEFDAAAERRRLLELARDPRNCERIADDGRDAAPLPSRLSPRAAEARDAGYAAVDELFNAGHLDGDAGLRLRAVARNDTLGVTSNYLAAVSSPDYFSAFCKRLAGGADPLLSDRERGAVLAVEQAVEARAMSLAEGKLGAYAVPAQLDPSILLTSSGATSPLREIARVVTVVASNIWRGVSSEGVEASFDAEGEEVSDDSPELGQPEIKTERATAFVPFSMELGQDFGALTDELARLMADAKAVLEAEKFLFGEGSGSNEPEGLVSKLAAESLVESETKEVYAVNDPYSLIEALPARFQPNASWISSLSVANATNRFGGGGGSEEPPLFNSDRTKLLGKPWFEASGMSSETGESGAKILAVGDFAAGYVICDRIGMSVELVPHLFGENRRPTGQRGLLAFWRVGAAPLIDNAVRVLKVK